jgi:hypothetical protein
LLAVVRLKLTKEDLHGSSRPVVDGVANLDPVMKQQHRPSQFGYETAAGGIQQPAVIAGSVEVLDSPSLEMFV